MTLKERFLRKQHEWMLGACYSNSHKDYVRYGEMGVAVDPRWQNSFETFAEDLLPTLPRSLSDRKIALKNRRRPFEFENVEWVFTSKESGGVQLRDGRSRHGLSKSLPMMVETVVKPKSDDSGKP